MDLILTFQSPHLCLHCRCWGRQPCGRWRVKRHLPTVCIMWVVTAVNTGPTSSDTTPTFTDIILLPLPLSTTIFIYYYTIYLLTYLPLLLLPPPPPLLPPPPPPPPCPVLQQGEHHTTSVSSIIFSEADKTGRQAGRQAPLQN